MKKLLLVTITVLMIFSLQMFCGAADVNAQNENIVQSSEEYFDTYVFLAFDEETHAYFLSEESNDFLCYFNAEGVCYLFSGVYNDTLFENGLVVKPESPIYFYDNGFIYTVDENSSVSLYIKSETEAGTFKMLVDGKCYNVDNTTAAANAYTGVFEGKYYKSGELGVSSETYYVYHSSYIYKVTKEGKASKYVKSSSTDGTYCMLIENTCYSVNYKTGAATKYTGVYSSKYYKSGKVYTSSATFYVYQSGYIYSVSKTGAAKKYIKTADKTGTYKMTVDSVLYTVEYATGAATKFTGVYDSKYYKSGKVGTASATYYAYYSGYIYSVSKAGAAKKYIKTADKSGTYKFKVDGVLYSVAYSTGAASKFTGVYDGKYYKSGKIPTESATYYVYYSSCIYKVTKAGAASKYIKSSSKSGNYLMTIDKVPYTVEYKTGAAKKITTGWYTLDSKKYYYKSGKYVTGWNKISDKYYFFNKSGVMSQNCIEGDYYVDKNGVRCSDETIKLAVKFVNAHSKKTDTNAKRLKDCYTYLYKNGTYTRVYGVPGKSDLSGRAKDMFKTMKGNCYSFAAAFAYIARVLGYDSKVEVGQVISASGSWANHGWSWVKNDGNWLICDPVKQWQFNKVNSYMVTKDKANFKYKSGTKYTLTVTDGKVNWS